MIPDYYWWFIIAIVIAAIELMIGTLYLLAVAVGIITGGIATLSGASTALSLLVTAIVALSIFALLKRYRRRPVNGINDPLQTLNIGQVVHIIEWKEAKHARVQYRGTQWDAKLIEGPFSPDIQAIYEIADQQNNLLLIRPQNKELP